MHFKVFVKALLKVYAPLLEAGIAHCASCIYKGALQILNISCPQAGLITRGRFSSCDRCLLWGGP